MFKDDLLEMVIRDSLEVSISIRIAAANHQYRHDQFFVQMKSPGFFSGLTSLSLLPAFR